MIAKPSAEPTPRPPLTTTLASTRRRPGGGRDALHDADGEVGLERRNEGLDRAGYAGRLRGDQCGATVSSCTGVWRRASSNRLPPQRTRVTSSPRTSVQFAASGRSRRAATRASISLPVRARRHDGLWREAARRARRRPQPTPRARRSPRARRRGGRRRRPPPPRPPRPRAAARRAKRERERLERELVAGLDENENGHATPSPRMTSTTAGAASGPWPRISACLPWPGGSVSRTFSSRDSARDGVLVATG